VIGYVARSAYLDGEWWPFEEYLLHAPGVGFRWLVCSDGHWSYVQPVATGAVTLGYNVRYDGVQFQRFQTAELRVDSVLGELYWRVQAGERVSAEDYIAPPAMLSREVSANEQNWSLSTYMTRDDVRAAFAQDDKANRKALELPVPTGVAPNQPYGGGIGKVTALVVAAFLALGIGKCASSPDTQKLYHRFTVPMNPGRPAPSFDPLAGLPSSSATSSSPDGAAAPAEAAVAFSDRFRLEGGRNVAFRLSANVSNNWVYAALDLVNDDTGAVRSIDKSIEYYSGTDGGESWSEGSTTEQAVIGPVEPGNYVLRVEAQHGGPGDVDLGVEIRQGVFRAGTFWTMFGLFMVPFAFVGFHAISFRKRRWENSNVGARAGSSSSSSDDSSDGGNNDD
jgi:hypothetical protein